jgi:dihydroxyacetone kinase-like predicted kinase
MITYYMDENVHGAITKALRQRNVNVLRVQEDGYMAYPDPEIVDRATALVRVLFSQDEDLLREATLRQRQGMAFSGVIYAHRAHVSIGQCVEDLDYLAQAGTPEDFTNCVYYLPL